GAGRTSDGNGSHASTLKSPSYTKSVSWQHYPKSLQGNYFQSGMADSREKFNLDLFTPTDSGFDAISDAGPGDCCSPR
ncbi:hypothetical protein, partial [Kluyvera huaxiensis]|uniref:hypothetical protein n=1 Tax=Kluyvera sp. 142053 TaxID=3160979 RepID=UPI0032DF723E